MDVMGWLLSLGPYGLLALAIALIAVATWLLEHLVFRALHQRAKAPASALDPFVLEGLHPGLGIIVFAAGSYAVVRRSVLPDGSYWVEHLFLTLLVLAGALTIQRLIRGVLRKKAALHSRRQAAATLGSRLIGAALYITAGLVVLDLFGVPISPILASVGIAGLAVALALQDTLSNFFAGIWIQSDRSVQPGHFVRVEDSKVEGVIVDIGWRTAKLRTVTGNIVVIPNSRLGQSVVTDFHLPNPRLQTLVAITVGYDADIPAVEHALQEAVLDAARNVQGLLLKPEPTVRLTNFGPQGPEVTLGVHVETFDDQGPVQHEVRKQVLSHLQTAGIRIPTKDAKPEGAP